MEQMTITHKAPRTNTRRLTWRQHEAWRLSRMVGTFDTCTFQFWTGYRDPSGALRRLSDRGLVERQDKGLYVGVTPAETLTGVQQ